MKVRFIKLGHGGEWEHDCLEVSHTIRLGYRNPFHQDCLEGQWDRVHAFWLKERKGNRSVATRDANQVRDFYELSEDDIWITFYQRRLYWCHASSNVEVLDDDSRVRRAIGSWSCRDRHGTLLSIENLDGRVSQVRGFRGTICDVKHSDYLLRRIRGEPHPEVLRAKDALGEMKASIVELIKGLWWKDFELLVELIFSRLGWQRVSVLGKTEKDIDIDVRSPVTQKRAFIQIKSQTKGIEFEAYLGKFHRYEQFDEFYFIFHSADSQLKDISGLGDDIHIWDVDRISELVIHAGLTDWVIQKRT
jgi:hypothetical protein